MVPDFLDNPAGRLLQVLRNISTSREQHSELVQAHFATAPAPEDPGFLDEPPDPSWTLQEIFAMDAERPHPLQVPLRLLQVGNLAAEARAAIEKLGPDEDPDFLLRHFDEIDRFAAQLMEDAASPSAVRLVPSSSASRLLIMRLPGKEALYGLEACSRTLHRLAPEPTISAGELADLVSQVRDLIDSVLNNTSLTEEAKFFLLGRLRDVESALISSRVTGLADLEAALDRLTGSLIRRADIREEGLLAKLTKFFRSLVGTAQGGAAIAGATTSTIEAINAISGALNH
jgi:hypothetical protein